MLVYNNKNCCIPTIYGYVLFNLFNNLIKNIEIT